MVTQIIAIDNQRSVTPLQTRQSKLNAAAAAWGEFQVVAGRFRDAAKAVRDATSFTTFSATASNSASTGRPLVSLSADKTAAPGNYSISVSQLAAAEKLGGAVASTATTALGISGNFAVNGSTVTVTTDDTLTTLRDKVNALNTGTTATGVSASILRSGAGARLVLSADNTGANGIEITDDASGTAQSLGFTDSTRTANISSSGLTQTNRLSSSTAALASLFGIPLPTPSVVTVGGQTISVDFSVDSLSSIAARINAATGSSDAASVVTETYAGRTFSRLQTSLAVEASPSDAANSARIMDVLGFTKAGRAGVQQIVKSANTFADGGNADAAAAATTLLSDLKTAGQSLGLGTGDVITLSGKRGDGTAVSTTLTIGAGTTMQDLLNAANANGGFGGGTRSAVATLSGGRIALTDSTAGDSQLGLSLTVTKAAGGTISLGAFSTDNGGTAGRSRQITAGTDAIFKIDDSTIVRSSNTVTDAITGVTVNLLAAEGDVAVNASVTRDTSAAVTGMQTFAQAYNDVRTWMDNNVATGKRLDGNTALKSMVASLSSALLQSVTGYTGSYASAAAAGLSRDKYGVLSVDATAFKAALTSDFNGVRRLFSQAGTPSDGEVAFLSSTDKTKATATPYAVNITQAATQASATGSVFATYATSGTPDTMTITDAATGYSGSVTLTNGDTIAKVAANLNSMFAAQKMSLSAVVTGGALKISSSDYGTAASFTVGYTAGSGDGTAQIGIAAGAYTGTNVAGTIGGYAATGSGRTLTGNTDTDVEGLAIEYTGTTARAAGTVAYSIGIGGNLYNVSSLMSRDLDGQIATLATAAGDAANALDKRINDAQDRIARRKEQLTAQFIAMESAMSKAQSLGSSLTSQINGLFNYNKQA